MLTGDLDFRVLGAHPVLTSVRTKRGIRAEDVSFDSYPK